MSADALNLILPALLIFIAAFGEKLLASSSRIADALGLLLVAVAGCFAMPDDECDQCHRNCGSLRSECHATCDQAPVCTRDGGDSDMGAGGAGEDGAE